MSLQLNQDEIHNLKIALQTSQEEARNLSVALAESWEELTLLYNLSESLKGVLDIEKATRLALEQTKEIVTVEGVGFLFKPPNGDWTLQLALCPPKRHEWLQTPLSQAIASDAIRRGRSFIINNLKSHPVWGRDAEIWELNNLITIPVNPDGQAKGALIVWNRLVGDFAAGEMKLLSTLAAQVGSVIESAYLFEQLEDTFRGVVSALATAVDAKSRWTAGHSHRVTQYALWLAEELNLSSDYLEKVRLSGLLHDIGKIGLPDSILEKSDRLTGREYRIVKAHPEIGYRILSEIKQFHGDILDGVLYHHERVDGKGYPHKLKGNEIPFMGRLLAIADGFDAMTSDRPYRTGIPKEKAIRTIFRGAGKHWDKDMALVFAKLMRKYPLLVKEEGF